MNGEQPAWEKEATKNTRTSFVFLSVDVIGHSKLYTEPLSNIRLAAIHRVLKDLQTFVVSPDCIPGYEPYMLWDWASDGGIFAFPSSRPDLKTTESVLDCAIRIWKLLPQFNRQQVDPELGRPIALHIAMDCGDAFYDENREIRRGDALNTAAKLKSPSGHTEILITERIKADLPKHRHSDFVVIAHDGQKPIYGYLPALERAMEDLGEEHLKAEQYVEAAQCHYRRAKFFLAAQKPSEAEKAFAEAAATLEKLRPEFWHRYFFRTLRSFYTQWRELVHEVTHDVERLQRFAVSAKVTDLFATAERAERGRLLKHLEFIFRQLDMLGEKIVNAPLGLSTLETALLLERMGYSPRLFGDALSKRLDRVERDIEEDNHRSIDGDCSLCTGVAVSALVLGNRNQRAQVLVDWLRLLKPMRFCWLGRSADSASHEYSLHYAACTLQGFLDFLPAHDRSGDIERIVEEFFRSSELDLRGFPKDWMRYRDIDVFEVCTFILPVFVRYLIAGYPLSEERRSALVQTLNALAKNLEEDAESAETKRPDMLDSGRENLASFALGLLIGMNTSAQEVANRILDRFDQRCTDRHFERASVRTFDSKLDRTRRYLDGWLLQWEVRLFNEER